MTKRMSLWGGAGLTAAALIIAPSSYGAPEYEKDVDLNFAVAPGGQLVISADMGPIRVTAGSNDKLEIHALRKSPGRRPSRGGCAFFRSRSNIYARRKHGDSGGQEEGSEFMGLEFRTAQFGGQLRNRGAHAVQLGIEDGPEATSSVGDLDGNFDARTSSGAIQAGKITGSFAAKNAGGNIVVSETGSRATASTTSGGIEIKKAGGTVEASDAGGNIRIGDASGSLTAHTTSGSISVDLAEAGVAATDAGGDIRIAKAGGNITARTTSGSITIGSAGGEVTAKNAGGDIHIDVANGNVSAETTSGLIAIATVKGESLKVENRGGNVQDRVCQRSGERRDNQRLRQYRIRNGAG